MGLANYTELKAAIASWLARASLPASVADECIDMAEAEFNRLFRGQDMKLTDDFATTAGDETATLPTGAKLLIAITHTDDRSPRLLIQRGEGEIADINATGNRDRPRYFCRGDSDEIRLAPIPDAVYTLNATFYKSLTPLSDAATTNWMLTKHPDLYLLKALQKACIRFVDVKRKAMIDAEVAPLMADLEKELEEEKMASSGTGQIQIKGGIV